MDDDAFVAFVDQAQPRLLRVAWGLTGDADAARDLVQDTLLRAYQHRRRLASADSPEAYLRVMLVNQWRSNHRRTVDPPVDAVHDEGHRDQLHLERTALREALSQLSAQQRLVVVLRHVDDLSVRQTAALAGCTEQTVTTQDARALARLRSHPHLAELLED